MNILAIGAHADDVELGCGGSLVKWAKAGHRIKILVVTESGYADVAGRPVRSSAAAAAEARRSAETIGAELEIGAFKVFNLSPGPELGETIRSVAESFRPDLALVHWDGDVHLDHRAVTLASLHALRHVPSLLMYRSNAYVAGAFDGNFAVDITATLDRKLELIGLFASENARTDGRWVEAARALAAADGHRFGIPYAEVFKVVRFRYD